jgi:hypothetical protein
LAAIREGTASSEVAGESISFTKTQSLPGCVPTH